MMCLLILTDGRWREQELPDEFLMQADKRLHHRGDERVVVTILDEDTEVEVEYDCKDILMDYCWFNGKFCRSDS